MLREVIAGRRATLRALCDAQDQKAIYQAQYELRVLYAQCRDAEDAAAYLMHYYDPHRSRRKGIFTV